MLRHNLVTFLTLLFILTLFSACSSSDETIETDTTTEEQVEVETEIKSGHLESDVELTEQIEADAGIESVLVQVVNGESNAVNVDIEINNEQPLSPGEMVKKYGEMIKEKYSGSVIDIMVVQDEKIVEQGIIE